MKVLATFVLLATFAVVARSQSFANSIPADVARDLLSNLNRSVNPCDDFYTYACGGWMARTTLPSDASRYDRSFNTIADGNSQILVQILQDAAANPGTDPIKQKIGTFFGSCMDEVTINSRGTDPLIPYFLFLEQITNLEELMKATATLHSVGVSAFFTFATVGDVKGPVPLQNIGDFGQGGLGLPARDYYLATNPDGLALLKNYQAHIGNMLKLAGDADPLTNAANVFEFETNLAKIEISNVDMRDPEATYNKIGLSGLTQLAPQLDWAVYLDAIAYASDETNRANINVEVPKFFSALSDLLLGTSPDVIRAYLRWQTVHAFADHLSQPFVDENFAFFGKILLGTPEIKSRTKRCVGFSDDAVGFLTGRYFVQEAFPGASKDLMNAMVADIENAFATNLPTVDWMTNETQVAAQGKLQMLVNNLGYPDNWPAYGALVLQSGFHFENVAAARSFSFNKTVSKAGTVLDRHEWQMTPSTVNAYYDPTTNTINFPAGILQPPFFNVSYPAPMNFGGIGLVAGHELTHGYDDQGARYDGNGRLVKWWDDQSVANFNQRTQCLANQYSQYEVEPGVFINGNLTVGENIADNGGIKLAFSAWRTWVNSQTSVPQYMAAYDSSISNDQLFFLSFAQTWCELATPSYEAYQVKVDVHSPAKFRVLGPLVNLPAFSEAFQCPSGSAMNPSSRCKLW